MSSNIAILTREHTAIAAKKRARRAQVTEVVFDELARRDFLTGFHKRKLAKADAARTKAKEREKQERLQARREQRQILREQAIENAAQVEKAYGAITGVHLSFARFTRSDRVLDDDDDDEWQGVGSVNQDNNKHDDEYENEETHATVTIIEDFDPDTIIHGSPKPDTPNMSLPTSRPEAKPIPTWASKKTLHGSTTRVKAKEKKIRYETKDARRREQIKQRARRTEKAELAGGKAARKSKFTGTKKKHGSKR
ncbi:nucleolar protein 12-domain-containing protein [Gymnopilus junonius]|uniref:Nucleolar protein 12-domain-containing protein n=1 Tax=Gymnopilus junonius TaxID=109634 RepID=A0A9P5NMY4_GYMJU|nr:nucleolar protein 12-domain-containing protein [Gymnopilus junonius]